MVERDGEDEEEEEKEQRQGERRRLSLLLPVPSLTMPKLKALLIRLLGAKVVRGKIG